MAKFFSGTAQKFKFAIKDLVDECEQIHRKMRIWSHLKEGILIEKVDFLCSASYWAMPLKMFWRSSESLVHCKIARKVPDFGQFFGTSFLLGKIKLNTTSKKTYSVFRGTIQIYSQAKKKTVTWISFILIFLLTC